MLGIKLGDCSFYLRGKVRRKDVSWVKEEGLVIWSFSGEIIIGIFFS